MADLGKDAVSEPKTSSRQGMLVLLVLALVQFTSIVDFMVVMPLGPKMTEMLKISASQFRWIVSSYSISAGIAGLLASSIMDRFGRKTAYLGLFAGFLLGTLACGLTRQYHALVAARAFTGAFGGILSGLGLTIIADVFPEEQRGRATGILMSAFALAPTVGVPAGLELGELYGWYVPFLVLAALGLLVFIAGLLVMPALRDHLHRAVHAHPLAQMIDTFRQRSNLIAFALTSAMMFGAFSVIPYISISLVANVGVPRGKLWLVFLTAGLMTLCGAPFIGALADRFGKLRVFRLVALIAAGLILVLTNLPPVPLAVAASLVGLLMVSNAGRMAASMSMITASVPSRFRGGLMSANSAVQHVSAGLGALIGGGILVESHDWAIADHPSLLRAVIGGGIMVESHSYLHNYGLVGLVSLGATLLSLWIAGYVKRAVETEARIDDSEAGRVVAGLME